MVTLSNQARKNYRRYLVKPVGDFNPTNWQQRPEHFTIVSRIETTPSQGKADSWAFGVNQQTIKQGFAGRAWAVVLD